MRAYYNEFDKKKCAALRALMEDGFITKGDVDDRPIQEVKANELKGYTRYHFFAGIGLWDYALNLAGWGESPVWTGSCPCQPFSSAGRQKGKEDDRHLWPVWDRLIDELRPATIFGEQVGSAVAHGWLDDVYQGLETKSYAVGSALLPACSVGAPHRRERLWFVANPGSGRLCGAGEGQIQFQRGAETQWPSSTLGDTKSLVGGLSEGQERGEDPEFVGTGTSLANAQSEQRDGGRCGDHTQECGEQYDEAGRQEQIGHCSETGLWSGQWYECADGKSRLVEPGICLLANGYPARVGLLHSAGDAIVPQVAAEFIAAYMEARG